MPARAAQSAGHQRGRAAAYFRFLGAGAEMPSDAFTVSEDDAREILEVLSGISSGSPLWERGPYLIEADPDSESSSIVIRRGRDIIGFYEGSCLWIAEECRGLGLSVPLVLAAALERSSRLPTVLPQGVEMHGYSVAGLAAHDKAFDLLWRMDCDVRAALMMCAGPAPRRPHDAAELGDDELVALLVQRGEDVTADRVAEVRALLSASGAVEEARDAAERVEVVLSRKQAGNEPRLPEGWPAMLSDEVEIARHVESLSPYDISTEDVEEAFRGCCARLRWVAIDTLITGDDDYNIAQPERQAECDRLPQGTMPPLVVESGQVKDGHHRLRTMRARNVAHCWVYDVEEIPVPSLNLDLDHSP